MASQMSTEPLRSNGALGAPSILSSAGEKFCFGRFSLDVRERLLLKDNREVSVGSRAFDLLLALIERAGETVRRRELFERVWPDVIVAEVNLRVHIAGLRKLLNDGQNGNRFIVSVPSRGYSFVAPVSRIRPMMQTTCLPKYSREQLPAQPENMLTAFAIAHARVTDGNSVVCFIDLAGIDEPARVAAVVASALQCEAYAQHSVSGLVSHLKHRAILLAFENCDHVFTGVVQLMERILNEAPLVQVLIRQRKINHSTLTPTHYR